MPTQDYTVSHTGQVLGTSQVDRQQNQVAPQRESPILSMEVPDNYDSLEYVGPRDAVRFHPRSKETFDGDGAKVTFALSADLIPSGGEPLLDDQPEPTVQAVADGAEATIDSIDYAADEVTLASAPAADTDNVHFFPLVTDGTVKFRGVNTLNQVLGPVYPWTHPVYRWADFNQDKRGTEINLPWPPVTVERNETLDVMLDSSQQIVWEDADYLYGSYVSEFEMDVRLTF
jgi:hypothetical protein